MNSKIVDQIKMQLGQRDGVNESAMAPLAEQYAEEVQAVNQRLSDCLQLLRKGLRSEAIQRAYQKPNLLDWSASLDFAEVEEWLEILQFLAIEVPPSVNREAAQQLQEAIVEEQPLEELLKQHRRLAIAKAPLAWRLKVLHRISDLDSMNGTWQEDIASWETARLKQIPNELVAIKEQKDLESIIRIQEELQSSRWKTAPTPALILQATKLADQFTYETQVEEATKLADELDRCFSEQNELQADLHRVKWNRLVTEMKTSLPKKILERAEPALVWLSDLDQQQLAATRYEQACFELEGLLNNNASKPDLERAYYAIMQCECGFDPELNQRYQTAIAERNLANRRKMTIQIAGIVAVSTLLLGSITAWQLNRSFQAKVETAIAELEKYLGETRIEEAESFWTKLESSAPAIAKSTQLASLASQLSVAKEAEANRKIQFDNYLEEASDDDPSSIDRAALNRAEKIARLESEKAAVFRLQQQIDAWEKKEAAAQLGRVQNGLKPIYEWIKTTEALPLDAQSKISFDSTYATLGVLARENQLSGTEGQALIGLAQKKVDGIRDAVTKRIAEASRLKLSLDMIKRSTTLKEFYQSLDQFVADHPNHTLSKEFSEVAKEKSLTDQFSNWNQTIRALRSSLESGLFSDEADQLSKDLDALAKNIDIDRMLSSILVNWKTQIDAIRNRNQLVGDLEQYLEGLLLLDLVVIDGKSPNWEGRNRFYLFESARASAETRLKNPKGTTGVEVLVDAAGVVKNIAFTEATISPDPRSIILELRGRLKERNKIEADWEGEFISMMGLIYARKTLDAMVKEMLLTKFVEIANEGSPHLNSQLNNVLLTLRSRSESRKDWYKQAVFSSQFAPELDQVLLPAFKSANQNKASAMDGLKRLAQSELKWIGSLQRNPSGAIELWLSAPVKESAQLLVVSSKLDSPDKADFYVVGSIQDGQTFLTGQTTDLVAGRPVFAMFLPQYKE